MQFRYCVTTCQLCPKIRKEVANCTVCQVASAKLTPESAGFHAAVLFWCSLRPSQTCPNSAMSLAHGGLPSTLPADVLAELKETAAKLCAPGARADADVVDFLYFVPSRAGMASQARGTIIHNLKTSQHDLREVTSVKKVGRNRIKS